MNKKVIFILIILMCIFAISHVSAMDDSDLTVDNITSVDDSPIELDSNDEQNCLGNESSVHHVNSGDDIQQAVDSASSGDTIILNGSFKLDNIITINKSLNISGADDGARLTTSFGYIDKTGLFIITSEASNVVLNNVKFVSVDSNTYGGAVKWFGDNGTITNCEFSKNMAYEYGGALVLTGNNCNVVNCTFSKNHVDQYGGALVLTGDNCNVVGCTFSENYASFYGGAIVVNGNDNLISECEFTDNYVSGSLNTSSIVGGGAIYSACDGEGLTIDKSSFKDNNARESYGGAIRFDKFTLINNSYFNNNSAMLGNDIYSNTISNVINNYFVLDYNETEQEAVYGDKIIKVNNTFNKTKIDSSITFVSTGMVFDYGHSGTIHVNVKGGSIGSIQVVKHPEAIIKVVNNVVTVSNLAVGSYTLRVTTTPDADHYSVSSDLSIKVNKATAVIKASKITVALKKGTSWTITLVDSKTGKGIANMRVSLKIYTGKKFKTVTVKTNSKGVATYKTSSLKKGTHKVVISASHAGYNFNTLTSSIKVVKPKKLTFKVAKRTLKDGSTIMFKVSDKKTKKDLNGIKLYLKIYTGKKVVKTISLKSRSVGKTKGIVGYTTNELTAGKHKVVLVPADVKYSGSKKSSIKITKKQKKYAPYSSKVSAK